MSAKSFCGQCVTKWYDPLQATYSSLEAWSRNDCKWFIQNPCLEILQVIHLRPLGHQEPCGEERLLPRKSYQRPKFQPKPWSLVCNVSKPLLSLCFRSLNLQNVAWAPWPLWCLPISFPGGPDSKEIAHNAGDLGSSPGSGSCPGERNSRPLQYSCLENSMDRGAWQATVHGVAKSRTQLSN